MNGRRLDIWAALRASGQVLARDFAAVTAAGFALIIIPGILSRSLEPGPDWMTLVTTVRGVMAMLFVALVSFGVVARLSGRRLLPHEFLRERLLAARPGLQTALIAGIAVMLALIIHLFSRHGTVAGWLLDGLLLSAGLWAVSTVMPMVPVAVIERRSPLNALQRAAALTEGNRDRLLLLALLVGLPVGLAGAITAGFGGEAGVLAKSLVEFIAGAAAGTVPAVVYAGLGEGQWR